MISEIFEPRTVVFGISCLHLLLNMTKFLIYNVGCGTSEKDSKAKKVIDVGRRISIHIYIVFKDARHGFGSKLMGNLYRRLFNNLEEFNKQNIFTKDVGEFYTKI